MHSTLRKILPKNYKYEVISFNELPDDKNSFEAIVRINLHTQLDAEEWLRKHENRSSATYRVLKTYSSCREHVIFKKAYRCHHNGKRYHKLPKDPTKCYIQNTGCRARLLLTVKNAKMKKSKDPYLKSLPCIIKIVHVHNHPMVLSNEVQRRRKPSEEVRNKFIKLFQSGFSPASALQRHKLDLKEKFGEKYLKVMTDGSLCPKIRWSHNLYNSVFGRSYQAQKEEIVIIGPQMDVFENEEVTDAPKPVSEKICDVNEVNPHWNKRLHAFKKGFFAFYENVVNKVDESPDVFLESCERFISNYRSLNNEQMLFSSMRNFGRESIQLHKEKKLRLQRHFRSNEDLIKMRVRKRRT